MDLLPFGNHKIKFNRSFQQIANEVIDILDRTKFVNEEFLRLQALGIRSDDPEVIESIKTRDTWRFNPEDEKIFPERGVVELVGPFDLGLDFDRHKITFWNPTYRYWQWFEMQDEKTRNEWRKYMRQVVRLFGGDRVIYLPDGYLSLAEINMEAPFPEMEKELYQKYGDPAKSFGEVAENIQNTWFLDHFSDL